MKSVHFPICLLCMLLAGVFLPNSYAQPQSLTKRIIKKSYVQLSGLGFRDIVPGDNSNYGFYHAQLAIGTKFKDAWGVGIGVGSWGISDGWYRITRHTVLGPHIRYIRNRWIIHLEIGGLVGYRLKRGGTSMSDDLSLSQPFGSPFVRLQYGIRFLRYWTVGLSCSFLPAVKSEGIRWFWTGQGSSVSITQKNNISGAQVFVGALLENRRSRIPNASVCLRKGE